MFAALLNALIICFTGSSSSSAIAMKLLGLLIDRYLRQIRRVCIIGLRCYRYILFGEGIQVREVMLYASLKTDVPN